ncbi:MAG TPA: addiction module toxin RelE, partial [Candidatus Binatia bacterium]|nr:addiction module toxin RelE [Candidatus Binatia bacterium]
LNPVRANSTSDPRQYKWSSYQATAGAAQAHPCLTPDEILGHFGQRRAAVQEKYRDFVQDAIGSRSIWEELEAQTLLGVEGFAEGLRHLLNEKQEVREIPKGQRFAGRPTLEKLFARRVSDKRTRDQLIEKAVVEFGYSQMELASFLDLHYSTISRILARTTGQQK